MSEFNGAIDDIAGNHLFIDFALIQDINKDDYELFDEFFLTLKKKETSLRVLT